MATLFLVNNLIPDTLALRMLAFMIEPSITAVTSAEMSKMNFLYSFNFYPLDLRRLT
jgi:hypothetical protein